MLKTNSGKDTYLDCSDLHCEAYGHISSWITGVPQGSLEHRSRLGWASKRQLPDHGLTRNHNFAQGKPGLCNLGSRLILRKWLATKHGASEPPLPLPKGSFPSCPKLMHRFLRDRGGCPAGQAAPAAAQSPFHSSPLPAFPIGPWEVCYESKSTRWA